jgi:hypothetical protein
VTSRIRYPWTPTLKRFPARVGGELLFVAVIILLFA